MRGYQRRKCSQCGEGLGFTESDPCERCSMESERVCAGCGHHSSLLVDGVCHWKRTRTADTICGHRCSESERPRQTERERVCDSCKVGDHNGCEAACIDGFCCCNDLDQPRDADCHVPPRIADPDIRDALREYTAEAGQPASGWKIGTVDEFFEAIAAPPEPAAPPRTVGERKVTTDEIEMDGKQVSIYKSHPEIKPIETSDERRHSQPTASQIITRWTCTKCGAEFWAGESVTAAIKEHVCQPAASEPTKLSLTDDYEGVVTAAPASEPPLVYEDELPDDIDYDKWYAQSRLSEGSTGVRVGPVTESMRASEPPARTGFPPHIKAWASDSPAVFRKTRNRSGGRIEPPAQPENELEAFHFTEDGADEWIVRKATGSKTTIAIININDSKDAEMYARRFARSAPTEVALTVEDALAELREMFPTLSSAIDFRYFQRGDEKTIRVDAEVGNCVVGDGKRFRGATLAEAMQQVHDWKEKQSNG